jgi:hypothetical protein
MTEPKEITKEEAIAALRKHAWTQRSDEVTCGHPGCEDHRAAGRTVIHSYLGGFGADWDLDGAIAAVESARKVAWAPHWMGHDLAVQTAEGKVVRFEAKPSAS